MRPSALHVHVKSVHRGIKPFKCDLCATAFSQRLNLVVHMRTHTGEKPYECDFGCGKSFARSFDCTKHHKTVHGKDKIKKN